MNPLIGLAVLGATVSVYIVAVAWFRRRPNGGRIDALMLSELACVLIVIGVAAGVVLIVDGVLTAWRTQDMAWLGAIAAGIAIGAPLLAAVGKRLIRWAAPSIPPAAA